VVPFETYDAWMVTVPPPLVHLNVEPDRVPYDDPEVIVNVVPEVTV
jgi:hypothetical protein